MAALSEIVPALVLERLLFSDELVEQPNVDKRTRLLWCKKEPTTDFSACCGGMIVRDGEVIARPIRKFWPLSSPRYPETWLKNLRAEGAVATRFIDGHPAILWKTMTGMPMLATDHMFLGLPMVRASKMYRDKHRHCVWPEGYTPNFVVTDPFHPKTLKYEEHEIYLVGCVNNLTGEEIAWADLKELARANDFPLVPEVEGNLFDLPHLPLDDRGVVVRWDHAGDPPLRVSIPSDKYETRQVIEGVSPAEIGVMLKEGLPLDTYKEEKYPPEFIAWLGAVENQLYAEYREAEQDLATIFNLAELEDYGEIQPKWQKANAMAFFKRVCGPNEWVLGPLRKMLDDEDYGPDLWDRVIDKASKKGWVPG